VSVSIPGSSVLSAGSRAHEKGIAYDHLYHHSFEGVFPDNRPGSEEKGQLHPWLQYNLHAHNYGL